MLYITGTDDKYTKYFLSVPVMYSVISVETSLCRLVHFNFILLYISKDLSLAVCFLVC